MFNFPFLLISRKNLLKLLQTQQNLKKENLQLKKRLELLRMAWVDNKDIWLPNSAVDVRKLNEYLKEVCK